MGRKLTGSWDGRLKRWRMVTQTRTADGRVTKHTIAVTARNLGKLYGEEVPATEAGSRPWWRRYRDQRLAELHARGAEERRRTEAFKLRVASLDNVIGWLEVEGRDTTALVRERDRVLTGPVDVSRFFGADPLDEITVRAAGGKVERVPEPAPVVVKDRLRDEAERYIRGRRDERNQWAAIGLFLEAAGDVGVRDVNVHVYRRFMEKLRAKESWNDTTKPKNRGRVNAFLHMLEASFDLNFRWMKLAEFRMTEPPGKKERYTLEEARLALANADGVARTMLLVGLNLGWYKEDLAQYDPAKHLTSDGRHVKKGRQKMDYLGSRQVVPVHLLWPETREALRPGITAEQGDYHFDKLRRAHGLKPHKALRKLVMKLIQDLPDETASRLYRGEAVRGVHGQNYDEGYNPEQVAILDKALAHVHKMLFNQGPTHPPARPPQ
jgi:hypothetical protein